MAIVAESLARRYEALRPHLTERQRRSWLGAEARELGLGGAAVVASAVGAAADTVRRGSLGVDDAQPHRAADRRCPGRRDVYRAAAWLPIGHWQERYAGLHDKIGRSWLPCCWARRQDSRQH